MIIVMAIMAVLVGTLVPLYLHYVEKTKKTTDCTAIGTVMDNCQIIAADVTVDWTVGTAGTITITFAGGTVTYAGKTGDTAVDVLKELTPESDVTLVSGWADASTEIVVKAVRDSENIVTFSLSGDVSKDDISAVSEVLAKRFE